MSRFFGILLVIGGALGGGLLFIAPLVQAQDVAPAASFNGKLQIQVTEDSEGSLSYSWLKVSANRNAEVDNFVATDCGINVLTGKAETRPSNGLFGTTNDYCPVELVLPPGIVITLTKVSVSNTIGDWSVQLTSATTFNMQGGHWLTDSLGTADIVADICTDEPCSLHTSFDVALGNAVVLCVEGDCQGGFAFGLTAGD